MNSTTTMSPAAPKYALGWALLTYVLCTMALAYPALTGGFLVTPISDQYIGGFPVRDFAAQSLKAGQGIPQWNPYIFGGMPYVASMNGDMFYPTFILRALLPTDVAMTWSFIIHMVLAGLFTYVFARSIGLSFFASLVGGVAYLMSGPIASYASPGHDGKLYVSALLPLVLFFLVRGVRDGRLWAWGGLALATGLAVLSPHPQLLQYLLLAGGAFGLFVAFSDWDGVRLDRAVAVRRLGYALVAVGLGFAMGAVQYYPVIEYVPWSPRAGGKGWEHAVSYSFPIEELLNTYVPQFTGILDRYWGRNGIHFHSEYLGPAMLVLASAAIGASGKAVALTRRFKWFWLGVLVVSLLWALGGNTPFYRLVYYLVPGTKYFRAPSTMIFVTTFAIALFAAIGTERLLAADFVSRRFMIVWGGIAGALALLGISGGLTNMGVSLAGNGVLPSGTPLADRVTENAGALALGSLRSLLFAAATLGVLWAAANRRLSGARLALALVVVLVVDLWSIERQYWRFSPPASRLYGTDATIDYLKARRDSARVITVTLAGDAAYHDPMLSGDGLMVHGIRQVLGYHGNELGRYDQLIGTQEGYTPIFTRPQLWSLLNTQYLMTNVPPDDPTMRQVFQGTRLVAGPARNAPGTMVYLYELPGEHPPAWVASTTMKAPDDVVLATIEDARFSTEMQHRVALLDTASRLPAVTDASAIPAASPIRTQVWRPSHGRILVELSAPAQQGNVLMVSENFYPGWRAKVDGREVVPERADFVLIGVPLTAGARRIELFFENATYEKGKLLTLISAGIATLLLIAGLVVDRRPRMRPATENTRG